MRRLGRAVAAVGIVALGLTVGCGNFFVYPGSTGGSGSTGTGDYVYVANATTQNVAGFQVGTGTLTAITGSPFSLGYVPSAAVVNPANSILFVASSGTISSYSISSSGVLASLSNPAITGLSNVVSMAVSPDGQWLFALDGTAVNTATGQYGIQVYEFQINSSTGALAATTSGGATYSGTYTIQGPTAPPTPVLSQIAVASVTNGEYVFVAMGTGGTLVIPFNTSTGVQSAPTQYGIPGGSSIYLANDALAVNSTTGVLYVVSSNTSSLNGTIAAYTIGSNAALTSLASGTTAFQPTSVALNHAGTDIYVGNLASNSISGFSTTASGSTLTALTNSPYSLSAAAVGLAADRSGDYLLAIANTGNPNLTMFSYDATTTGQLDEAASTATGTNPVAIAVTH